MAYKNGESVAVSINGKTEFGKVEQEMKSTKSNVYYSVKLERGILLEEVPEVAYKTTTIFINKKLTRKIFKK